VTSNCRHRLVEQRLTFGIRMRGDGLLIAREGTFASIGTVRFPGMRSTTSGRPEASAP
jgi:hypothetical protein